MPADIDLINSEVKFPNGVRVPNRLVKASMEEGIGTGGGLPGKHHQRLYSRWAEGGWGMMITGMRSPSSYSLAVADVEVTPKWTRDILRLLMTERSPEPRFHCKHGPISTPLSFQMSHHHPHLHSALSRSLMQVYNHPPPSTSPEHRGRLLSPLVSLDLILATLF